MKKRVSPWKLALALGLLSKVATAQLPEFEWAHGINGTTNAVSSDGYSVAVDPMGNVYTTGAFSGTVDFDPGPAVFNMTASTPTAWGMFIRKVDGAGNFLWARMVACTSQSEPLAIAADNNYVYTTGYFNGSADFNPGAATNTLTSAGSQDLFMLTLTVNGAYQGSYRAGSTGVDRGSSITVRSSQVFVAGIFSGSFDADPTVLGTSIITSNGGTDICILKLGPTGTFSWVRTMGSTVNDASSGAVARDKLDIIVNQTNGDIYTTGNFGGSMDIDPTAGITTLSGVGCFVQKLTAAGAFVWGNQLLAASGRGITIDNSGNVYTIGGFGTTTDFDPGAGIVNLNPGANSNVYVRKLDTNGNYVWAVQMGGTGFDDGYAIATGASGNVYATGRFEFTADFDPSAPIANLVSSGGIDIFICGLSSAGTYLWSKKIGGAGFDYPYDLVTDYAEAIYSSGSFQNTVDFNTEAGTYNLPLAGFTSSIVHDAYLHKLAVVCQSTPTNPGLQWATDMGGTGFAYAQAVETDAAGNVYTTGHFNGVVDFDPSVNTYTLGAVDGYDGFIQKQDALGNLVWVKQIMGKGNQYSMALSVDNSGNVAVGGFFTGDIGTDPNATVTFVPSTGAEDIFLFKLDPTGSLLWSRFLGGTTADKCLGIEFDGSGNLGFTGSFTGTIDMDPGAGVTTMTALGLTDMYVEKLDVNGNLIWARQQAGTGDEEGRSLCFDASGFVYVCGLYSSTTDFNYTTGPAFSLTSAGSYDGFVLRLYPTGNWNWSKRIAGAGNDKATSIAIDNVYGMLYVTGLFTGTADFNGQSMTSVGTDDAFLFKLTTTGSNAWIKQIGALSGVVVANAVATDNCSDVYVTGNYVSACDFNPNAGVTTLTPVGMADAFIFKLTKSGVFSWAKSMGGTSSDNGQSIFVDAAANVYTTGSFQVTSDFNPGAGVLNLVSAASCGDVFVQKLNTAFPVRLSPESEETTLSIEMQPTLNLFPNPSSGQFTMTFGASINGQVEVYDLAGQLIKTIAVNDAAQQEMDLRDLAKGIYLVRVSTATWSEGKRIIIQ